MKELHQVPFCHNIGLQSWEWFGSLSIHRNSLTVGFWADPLGDPPERQTFVFSWEYQMSASLLEGGRRGSCCLLSEHTLFVPLWHVSRFCEQVPRQSSCVSPLSYRLKWTGSAGAWASASPEERAPYRTRSMTRSALSPRSSSRTACRVLLCPKHGACPTHYTYISIWLAPHWYNTACGPIQEMTASQTN